MTQKITRNNLTDRALKHHCNEKTYKTADTVDFIITLVLVVLAVFAFRSFIFEPIRVSGSSMESTLYNNDRMFVEKFTYWFDRPSRGDIIICYYPPTYKRGKLNDTYVKRVIGLPGETIRIENCKVYIKGTQSNAEFKPLTEKYIDPADLLFSPYSNLEYKIPNDCIFVMGDNRDESADSRANNIGAIKLTSVVGKVHGVIYPISHIKEINTVNYGE